MVDRVRLAYTLCIDRLLASAKLYSNAMPCHRSHVLNGMEWIDGAVCSVVYSVDGNGIFSIITESDLI